MSSEIVDKRPPRTVVQVNDDALVPVTLVTGYLGAGKTTLVNAILRNKRYRRIAVVENEFGEINIDGSLVAANLIEEEDLVSLTKGCVCCSLRKDIAKALRKLYQRSSAENKRFDAVLLETTGLADPAPVAFTFFANPWIAKHFKLDSILCVVDALFTHKNFSMIAPGKEIKGEGTKPHTEEDPVNEAVQQLAFADTVLINKIDLVKEEELEDVKKLVQTINSTAKVLHCQLNKPEVDGKIGLPMDKVLDLNAFALDRALEIDPNFLATDSDLEEDATLENIQSDAGSEPSSPHGSSGFKRKNPSDNSRTGPKRRKLLMHDTLDIYSVGITAQGPLHPWRFNMFMRDFFVERHTDIFRSKGVLCIKGYEDTKFVFQGVHDKLNYGPSKDPWGENELRINKVVFIGRNLDREGLKEAFRSCVWTPLPPGWSERYGDGDSAPTYRHEDGTSQREMPVMASAHVQATGLETTSQHNLQVLRREGVPVP